MRTWTSAYPIPARTAASASRQRSTVTTLAPVRTSSRATTAKSSRSRPATSFPARTEEHAEMDPVSLTISYYTANLSCVVDKRIINETKKVIVCQYQTAENIFFVINYCSKPYQKLFV